MKKLITNPLANIPVNEKSHTYGWSMCWSHMLRASINHKCDKRILDAQHVYIDHGVNFNGSLNLFGGLNENVYTKFNYLINCKNVTSLDHDMPDYGEMFKKRIGLKSTHYAVNKEWCNKVSDFCKTIKKITYYDSNLEYSGITVGDSHSIAFSKRYDLILRQDGATLYSTLQKGLYVPDYLFKDLVRITYCYGSVDIRHHIVRNNTNWKELLNNYIYQAKQIQDKYGIRVELACPVPVEHEDRRIPKTGYFKDTPFYGSQQERAELTKNWIKHLFANYNHNQIIKPLHNWYDMEPEKYAKQIMELSSSVHIAPTHYRRADFGLHYES